MTEFEGETTIYCACENCVGGSIIQTILNKFRRRAPQFHGCGSEYEQDVTIEVEPLEDDRYA